MDELLLQLAESLRKTMTAGSAEVYTGTGDVLEGWPRSLTPGPRSVVVSARERAGGDQGRGVRAGLGSVWLPALLDGRRGPGAGAPAATAASCSG